MGHNQAVQELMAVALVPDETERLNALRAWEVRWLDYGSCAAHFDRQSMMLMGAEHFSDHKATMLDAAERKLGAEMAKRNGAIRPRNPQPEHEEVWAVSMVCLRARAAQG